MASLQKKILLSSLSKLPRTATPRCDALVQTGLYWGCFVVDFVLVLVARSVVFMGEGIMIAFAVLIIVIIIGASYVHL